MATTKVTSGMRTLATDEVVTANITDANVTTAKVADNAITLAKMAGGTDGNIISFDAAGDPVAVATGTAGQVLTSAGAGAPPTMSDPSFGWEFVEAVAATAASPISTSTSFVAGYDYEIIGDSLFVTNDAVEVTFNVGTGSALTGANDYQWRNDANASTSTAGGGGEASHQLLDTTLTPGIGSDSNLTPMQIQLRLFNPNEGTYATRWLGDLSYMDSAAVQLMQNVHFAGLYEPVTAITSAHFSVSAGTFTAQGSLLVYRRKRTA